MIRNGASLRAGHFHVKPVRLSSEHLQGNGLAELVCGDGLLEDRGIEIRRDLLSVDSDDAITRIQARLDGGGRGP